MSWTKHLVVMVLLSRINTDDPSRERSLGSYLPAGRETVLWRLKKLPKTKDIASGLKYLKLVVIF